MDGMANYVGTPLDLTLYAGVNSGPQSAADGLEVENRLRMWVGGSPEVDSMGWELMFGGPPEVDSLGWEAMLASPPEIDSMGWEAFGGPPEVDNTG